MENTNAVESATVKKSIERSAAYPAITIEEAAKLCEGVARNFPGNPSPFVTREDIAAVLKAKAGSIQRDIAAAGHYGFLNRDKSGYQVSELFKTLLNPIGEKERKRCLLTAFGSPKLYQELLEKHDGHAIPQELKTHLIRFHKITENVAQEVADDFIANAKFVGATNEHGILTYKSALAAANDGNTDYVEVITETKNDAEKGNNFQLIENGNQAPQQHPPFKQLPPIPEAENIKIPLSEKKVAYLAYPNNINKKDIQILRAQIDLLELLAE